MMNTRLKITAIGLIIVLCMAGAIALGWKP